MKYTRIDIKSKADLKHLKWGEQYFIKMKNGDIFEHMGYNPSQNKSWFLNNVDWYLIENTEPSYPEEFIHWKDDFTSDYDILAQSYQIHIETHITKWFSLNELHEFWLNEIKDK